MARCRLLPSRLGNLWSAGTYRRRQGRRRLAQSIASQSRNQAGPRFFSACLSTEGLEDTYDCMWMSQGRGDEELPPRLLAVAALTFSNSSTSSTWHSVLDDLIRIMHMIQNTQQDHIHTCNRKLKKTGKCATLSHASASAVGCDPDTPGQSQTEPIYAAIDQQAEPGSILATYASDVGGSNSLCHGLSVHGSARQSPSRGAPTD